MEINQFIGELGILGFRSICEATWIAAKDKVSVAFWGNDNEPDVGDLIVKEWNKIIEDKPNGKLCLSTKKYANHDCQDLESALTYIKDLLCKQN